MAGPWNRHRRDNSHAPVVERLRQLGCSVRDVSQSAGKGEPDLLVGILGRDYQVEVKSHGKVLSDEQRDWHERWQGQRPVTIWTADQAEEWVKATQRRLFKRQISYGGTD